MSKAFTKEAEGNNDEGGGDDEGAATRGSPYITPAGFRKLQEELEHLWKVERPRVTAEVAAAAAQGDRSENAEYIYGKKRLREIDRRVRFLSKRLDVVQVVEPAKEQEGRVFFGAWVTIEDEDGKEATYRIVGTDEPDAKQGWISVESPAARALLGKREGDVVTIQRPRGPTEVTVIAIAYEAPKRSR
jgi:transcription elongation factor GreB